MHLEKCTTDDLHTIAEMAGEIWNAYYPEFLPTDQIRYMLDKFYALPALQKQVEEGQVFYTIFDNDRAIGFIAVSQTNASEFFIHKFYLYPSDQGKHYGSLVMQEITNRFRNMSNIKNPAVRLTVNRQNYKAINFYFKNGFTIERVADFDIGNGYQMNDFVMLKTLQ